MSDKSRTENESKGLINKSESLIKVEDLSKHFGELAALKGVSNEIKKGEVVVIIGPSGSGKSTFLRCLNLLEVPTASSMMSALYPDEKSKLSWLNFAVDGSTRRKMQTYHVPSDDWYFLWPEQWDSRVVVQMSRYSRMVKTSFFVLPDHYGIDALPTADENNTILTLYIFSGDNQQAYLANYKATEILRRDGMVYAYTLGRQSDKYAVTDQEVSAAFKTIETEWTLEAYGG